MIDLSKIVLGVSSSPTVVDYSAFLSSTSGSFPEEPTANSLAPFDASPLIIDPEPSVHAFQRCVLSSSPYLDPATGEWHLGWDVVELSDSEKSDLVNSERDRRLMAGTFVTPTGHSTPVYLNHADEPNLVGLTATALFQVQSGNGSQTVTWRDNSNVLHELTYDQVIEMQALAAAFKQAVYEASWSLKDSPSGIPLDYADDAHWL